MVKQGQNCKWYQFGCHDSPLLWQCLSSRASLCDLCDWYPRWFISLLPSTVSPTHHSFHMSLPLLLLLPSPVLYRWLIAVTTHCLWGKLTATQVSGISAPICHQQSSSVPHTVSREHQAWAGSADGCLDDFSVRSQLQNIGFVSSPAAGFSRYQL